ncbi:MAG: hypothetical protein VCC99_04155 [Alphaproteobacteria bacterium]|jgi:hypothetical protein
MIPLGFDLRDDAAVYLAREWTDARRALYLLRDDVAWPKSVDSLVWPSPIDGDRRNPVDRTDMRGWVLGLWSNLDLLPATDTTAHRIRIDLLLDRAPARDDFFRFLDDGPPPLLGHSESWAVIGFDVADTGFISGLSNCGYDDEERAGLNREWGPRINDHGLFESTDDAREFVAVSNARIPEHAPFYVMALRAETVF